MLDEEEFEEFMKGIPEPVSSFYPTEYTCLHAQYTFPFIVIIIKTMTLCYNDDD